MGPTKPKIFAIWLFAVEVHRPFQEPRNHWDRQRTSRSPQLLPQNIWGFQGREVFCTALGGRARDSREKLEAWSPGPL